MAANPSNPAELYAALLTAELAGLSSAASLGVIGSLIDLSDDLGEPDGARRALELSDLLEATKLPEADAALLEYFRANAWSVLQRHEPTNLWDWEQPALGKQIFYLRKCVCHAAFSKLDKLCRCQVFANLGNCMDTVGRFIEAQEYWGQALTLEPKFGMAVGNKGCGLETYAQALYDPGHQMLFVKFLQSLDCERGRGRSGLVRSRRVLRSCLFDVRCMRRLSKGALTRKLISDDWPPGVAVAKLWQAMLLYGP